MSASSLEPLAPTAAPADAHRPYISSEESPAEFTASAVITGALLGLVFGVSSLYLVLKVGLTVSASIPVAVLAITLFRAVASVLNTRPATILENNITQTAGSAGESIAFGVGVTMPAMMLLGFDMDLPRVMMVSVLGGLLGILMMVPLRRALIVAQRDTLVYPEGTACAQVLIAGDSGSLGGRLVFVGFGLGFAHQFATVAFDVLREGLTHTLGWFNRAATVGCALESALLGVGYIIGLRTAAVMMAGAVLGYLVLVPAIATFGDAITVAQAVPGNPGKLISQMSVSEIRSHYLLYLGAGCVATAGLLSMFKTLPLVVRSAAGGLSALSGIRPGAGANTPSAGTARTETDLSTGFVVGGSLVLLGLLTVFLMTDVGLAAALAGAALILVFGFLFVTVSSRLTGEIGSTSNPISGMTVATLSVTCLIFLSLGWTSPSERVLALSVAAVVCIAASNGGTTSQDLKTGYLVGGTPRLQQWAILIGALVSALVLGGMLMLFNEAGTVVADLSLPHRHDLRPKLDDTLVGQTSRTTVDGSRLKFVRLRDALPEYPDGILRLDSQGRVIQTKGFPDTFYSGRQTLDGVTYYVWRPDRNLFPAVGNGKYLVEIDDPQQPGRRSEYLRYYVDPAITGTLTARDDGTPVKFKFEAPKTQVMGVIINGVLQAKLNWGLVLMGAMIAIALELCGISSLAFAVGVYIPMSYSAPIFLGGLTRSLVDYLRTPPDGDDHAAAIAKTETSPGMLLASGYIAGGSLAGVVAAFLQFDSLSTVRESLNFSGAIAGTGLDAPWPSAVAFVGLALTLVVIGYRGGRSSANRDIGTTTAATDQSKIL